jgi:hypothetical protein
VPQIEVEEMRQIESGRRSFGAADDLAWRARAAASEAGFAGRPSAAERALELAR